MKSNFTAVDSKCIELAEHYLQDESVLFTDEKCAELSGAIQAAIEDWFETEKDNYEPPDPPGFEGGFAENH